MLELLKYEYINVTKIAYLCNRPNKNHIRKYITKYPIYLILTNLK